MDSSQLRNQSPCEDTLDDPHWVNGRLDTPAGQVAQVATRLERTDHMGTLMVRLNIRRMHYAVESGLYAVGSPSPDSPVLVSANYKLSFDCLRQVLGGVDAWVMVLDTKGVNVWCAAGKGTFGTDEIINRIEATELGKVVTHRRLILPQLGAPGVAAHEVKKQSGFRVIYGPVYARDIPRFLKNGMQATSDMRQVRFGLYARLAVVPVDLMQQGRHALLLMAGLILLAGMGRSGYDSGLALEHGSRAALRVLTAFFGGGLLAPILLPWLPGRAFPIKGAVVGFVLACATILSGWWNMEGIGGWLEAAAWFLVIPTIAAFMTMNFTGASTYTSLSGVKKEMRYAIPIQIVAGITGIGLWVMARFFY